MSEPGSNDANPKYAWREHPGKGRPKRSAAERVGDFLEVYGLYDEATAREQATRCIQCPNPTCVAGCPLCSPVPEWMQLTAEGRFLEAAAVLSSGVTMAEICARVCPAERLCEAACILEGVSQPVAISTIEEFLGEYALAHGHDASNAPPNGRRVAIVGAGPGGLACADELTKRGYAVTIFDEALVPGGLLVNGVAAFRLEQSIVQRRVDILKRRGVSFRLGVSLWENPNPAAPGAEGPRENVTLTGLQSQFDAVFLGFDSRKARPLEVPGVNLRGVVQALPFILQKNTTIPLELPLVDLAGKRVVVLGGGDTAMDCLRTAIRCGAREATGVYRREEFELRCARNEYENAREEGARFLFRAAPVAVLGEDGRVTGLRLVRTEPGPAVAQGRRPVTIDPGTEFEIEADWIILALGFDPQPCPQTDDFNRLALNTSGGLVVDANQMTNLRGVFAAGDIVRGPSLVVEIVRDARLAAGHIHTYLTTSQRRPAA